MSVRIDTDAMSRNVLEYLRTDSMDHMRPCGECSVCCISPAIRELGKPAGTPCEKLIQLSIINRTSPSTAAAPAAGCSVYADRPDICRTYACLWKGGGLAPDDYRPDKLGILFQVEPCQHLGTVLCAYEATPNSFRTNPRAAYLLQKLVATTVVAVWFYRPDGTMRQELWGPRDQIERIRHATRPDSTIDAV